MQVVNWVIIIPVYPHSNGGWGGGGYTGFISKFGPNVDFVIFLTKKEIEVLFAANSNQCKEKWRTGILETFLHQKCVILLHCCGDGSNRLLYM